MSAHPLSTVVVGAGAVGSYFGAMLALAGHAVTLIGRPAHVQAIQSQGLRLDKGGQLRVVPMAARSDLAAVRGAGLVLVCVKSTDTAAVARELETLLAPDALVLSLQNGVENAATLAHHLRQTVVPVAVYVATALPEPGLVRHFGRGDLVLGPRDADDAARPDLLHRLQAVADMFTGAGVPVRISDRVMLELWNKLLVNCAYNAVSALAQQPYGVLAAQADIRALQHTLVQEVLAVARADGIALDLEASMAAVQAIAAAMPAQLSSTAQDLARGKRSEIDHLNGFVARRGAERGIPTPANQTLYALVKLVEGARASA